MELRDYLKVLTRNWAILLIVTIVAVGSGYLILSRQETRYTSDLAIIVNYQEQGTISSSDYFKYNNYYGNLIAQSFSDSLSGLMKNAGLVEAVFKRASISYEEKDIANPGKYFSPIPKSKNVTEVRFTADTASEAQALSSSLISLLTEKAKEFVQSQGEGSLELGVEGPVIEKGEIPLVLYLLLLAVVGCGFGIFLAFLLTYLRDEVSSVEEFEKILSTPLWADLSLHSGSEGDGVMVPLREKILAKFPQTEHREVRIGLISLRSLDSLRVCQQLASALRTKENIQTLDLTARSEAAALEELKKTDKHAASYRLIAMPSFDSLSFSHRVLSVMDAVILVADSRHTPRRSLLIVSSQLSLLSAPRGIVLI
ncbi:hypothetical protein AUK40_03990 [Candidatus Wirthbacteria bacterium CG2_30_54_11]|uniref:Polysaccharide chain length determinant N-terminal domain-containing protein n=1 Tax=Candidatus Wirthbacteria bacterium CG2_30_54_11 TaxID=1817892 RepID=A0A1J5IJ60_9BACT|nr:MAG: hypothetical protein AUK40_03990 [Candidatus Wirthbacteria bacterium CG2_30_54_11]